MGACYGKPQQRKVHPVLYGRDADLNLVTMYAYEGYTVTEISKVLGVAQPTISIKIKRITKFLKNFNFNAMD